jgi:CBS domain-containing protein
MGDTFYTNDPKSIQRVSEMLNDAWKRGMEISQLTSQPGMKLPTVEVSSGDTVSKLVGEMLRCNVESILITENGKPMGVVSDRELLGEIVENRKDPEKTRVGDIEYTPLITLDESQSIVDALKMMREKGAPRVAVVKNGQLVSMLTEDLDEAKKGIPVKTRTRRK